MPSYPILVYFSWKPYKSISRERRFNPKSNFTFELIPIKSKFIAAQRSCPILGFLKRQCRNLQHRQNPPRHVLLLCALYVNPHRRVPNWHIFKILITFDFELNLKTTNYIVFFAQVLTYFFNTRKIILKISYSSHLNIHN